MPMKHLDMRKIMSTAEYRHGKIFHIRDEMGRKIPEDELRQYDAHALDCSVCNRRVEQYLAKLTSI